MTKLVAYLRGNDLDRQREVVEKYAIEHGCDVLATYTEVDRIERPIRSAVIAAARESGASILVASLDRFSRDVSLVNAIQGEGIQIIVCQSVEGEDSVV